MRLITVALALAWLFAGLAAAQLAGVGGFQQDSDAPVEISADSLAVDQAAGTAVFTGNVVVGQGILRLAADRVEVVYASEGGNTGGSGAIEEIRATGNITLTNGVEAAEAETAVYRVGENTIDMTGDVLLTQGGNALSGDALAIDLTSGQANMAGRVRTVIQPGTTQ